MSRTPPPPPPPDDLGFEPRVLGHMPSLDGLRGFSVMIVVIAHLNIILNIPRVMVVPGGVVSLDSFFILSGFLITYLLLREQAKTGRVSSMGFYRRRALRLLPALCFMLIVHAIYSVAVGIDWDLERSSILSVLFYYSNWYLVFAPKDILGGGIIAPGFSHLWSLSFEEQFYLIWPIVTIFVLTIRTKLRTVVIVLGSIITLVALHRFQVYQSSLNGDPVHDLHAWYPVMIRTDTRADSILFGALLAHVWIRGKVPTKGLAIAGWISALFLLVCFPLIEVEEPFLYRGGMVLMDVALVVFIISIVEGKWSGVRLFLLKPFIWIGMVSYGLYLWHLPVLFAVRHFGEGWNQWVRFAVFVVVCAFFTVTSYFLLERPAMRWKERLEKRDATKGATGDAEMTVATAND